MTSFNTYLKFYRIWMNEEDARKAAKRMMEKQHNFIRGPDWSKPETYGYTETGDTNERNSAS